MAKKKSNISEADQRVQDLINLVKKKREKVKNIENPNKKTNGAFRYNPESSATVNLHIETNVNSLVGILAWILSMKNAFASAAVELGVEGAEFKWLGFSYEDWKSDISSRINKINLKKEKEELEVLEERLNKLISPELKREMELEEIGSMLAK